MFDAQASDRTVALACPIAGAAWEVRTPMMARTTYIANNVNPLWRFIMCSSFFAIGTATVSWPPVD
jgi:hypothetical protein